LRILEELSKINFIGCTHRSIWVVAKEEDEWAKKNRLAQMRKFEWTTIDEPLVKEFICNFCS
jgi:hypothetical protein